MDSEVGKTAEKCPEREGSINFVEIVNDAAAILNFLFPTV